MQLELDSVTFAYRSGATVIDNVSLNLKQGCAVALMGPSGSGKSTLLALVGKVIRPTSGSVHHHYAPADSRTLGWVLQSTNALPRRTVLDNVVLGAYASRLSRRDAVPRARSLLQFVGLSGYEHRRAATLSGGELQRAVVARAIVGHPPLLLADEPTGQLDRENTILVLDALFGARPTETILLVATHDPEVADRCDYVMRMVQGRILEESAR